MTKKRDRFFALMGAILFFVTASALTIAIIVSAVQENHRNKAATNSQSTKPASQLAGTQLKNFTPVESVTELQKTDTKVGTGKEAQAGDTVTVDYTGAVAATGVIFQSSLDSGQPVSFALNQVIKGWSDGVPGMKEGGTRRLLIPAEQAYGANPPSGSGIPANAALVFDITLHKVGQ